MKPRARLKVCRPGPADATATQGPTGRDCRGRAGAGAGAGRMPCAGMPCAGMPRPTRPVLLDGPTVLRQPNQMDAGRHEPDAISRKGIPMRRLTRRLSKALTVVAVTT